MKQTLTLLFWPVLLLANCHQRCGDDAIRTVLLIFMKLAILFCLAGSIFAQTYANGTVLVGDANANTITVTDTGAVGRSQTVSFNVPSGDHFEAWIQFSAGFPEPGSSSACHAPCAINMNTEYGANSVWYKIYTSGEVQVGAQGYTQLSFAPQAPLTPPFTTPALVHGTGKGSWSNYQWNPGSLTTSGLRVWVRALIYEMETPG